MKSSIAKAKSIVRKRAIDKAKAFVADKKLKALVQAVKVDGKNGVNGANGRDGKDAPDMAAILNQVKPLLPTPVIEQTTIVQKMEQVELSDSTVCLY